MRRCIAFAVVSLLLVVAAPAFAAEHSTYRCAADYAAYTGCAVIKNDVQSWVAPGKLAKNRPLVFAAYQEAINGWEAQTSIPGGQTGDAIVGAPTWAAGAFLYSLRPTEGSQNYQAVVGFRLDDDASREGCIVSTYLDCNMGQQLETGRDSKHVFTVTSRPFEVRIANAMPVDLKRIDGPYWTNALPVPVSDSASRISASGGTGTVGSLRSVKKTAAFAVVYKFQRSDADPRFNSDSVLISVKTTADGKRSGSCDPVFPPSGTRFACTLSFAGSDTGHLIATARVYIP